MMPGLREWGTRLQLPFIFFGGFAAWLVQLLIGYFFVPLACINGTKTAFYVLSVMAALVTLAAAGLAFGFGRTHLQTSPADTREIEEPYRPRAFLAMTGFAMNCLFLALIAATGVTGVVLSPCPYITMTLP